MGRKPGSAEIGFGVAIAVCFLLLLWQPGSRTGFLFILILLVALGFALIKALRRRNRPPQPQPKPTGTSAFEGEVQRLGVKARRYAVSKVLDNNGTSKFTFHLDGLEVTEGELAGVSFYMHYEAGYVTRPQVEPGQNHIEWKYDSDCREKSLTVSDTVECVRTLKGHFEFDPLRPGESLTFQWTVTVLNGDALTKWEYMQIYGKDKVLEPTIPHVIGQKEFFSKVAWFPIESLLISVKLPARLPGHPSLYAHRLRGRPSIRGDEVVRDSKLFTYPRPDSEWVAKYVDWDRDKTLEDGMRPIQLQHDGTFSLTVNRPPVDSRFVLEWDLVQTKPSPKFVALEGRAQNVRKQLLDYAGKRQQVQPGPAAAEIKRLFQEFDAEIRQKYGLGAEKEQFTVRLMTYDQTRRLLVVVEGLTNGGDLKESPGFSLPFGWGLGGACFREAKAFMYVGSEDTIEDDVKYYVPVQGSGPYRLLLALPVDHKDFTESEFGSEAATVERSRQLTGVITIGSDCPATELYQFAIEAGTSVQGTGSPATDQSPAEPPQFLALHARCQKLSDDICDVLQSRTDKIGS